MPAAVTDHVKIPAGNIDTTGMQELYLGPPCRSCLEITSTFPPATLTQQVCTSCTWVHHAAAVTDHVKIPAGKLDTIGMQELYLGPLCRCCNRSRQNSRRQHWHNMYGRLSCTWVHRAAAMADHVKIPAGNIDTIGMQELYLGSPCRYC